MARIAISYRRMDSAGYAGRLYDSLSTHFSAHEIFMDISTLEPGVDFVDAIERAVSSCDVLLVLVGPQWVTASDEKGRRLDNPEDFVRLEVATALNRGIRVIPVLIQGTLMPRSDQLPSELRGLTRRQACELSDARWRYDVGQLIATLERALNLAAAPVSIAPSAPTDLASPSSPSAPSAPSSGVPNSLGLLVPAAWIAGAYVSELLYDPPWRLAFGEAWGPSWVWAATGALGAFAMVLATRPAGAVSWSRLVPLVTITAAACALIEWMCLGARVQLGLLDADNINALTLLGAVGSALVTGALTGLIVDSVALQSGLGRASRSTFASGLIVSLSVATGMAVRWGVAFEELRVPAFLIAAALLGWILIREREQLLARVRRPAGATRPRAQM